ncbi:hypothetical protein BD410DRAFT_755085 [Rickenella mellea]|uniref:Uncharacterized protein n=1 Tax=Rickenella mellea TaxID=50990 RepID=A0A4Y7PP40_9AGAM|nr:hypothetical protein BD410DRAFT_755085 [Rickenella mellea]
MHRALTIPELLEIIFSSTEELANARSVLVCKTWSVIALDTLWRDVRGLPRLFSLLAPVKRSSSFYEFKRPIQQSDWTKFHKAARRVRYLTVTSGALGGKVFRADRLREVLATCQTSPILPNLIELTVDTGTVDEFSFSIILLHQSLRRLALKIPDQVPPKTVFSKISVRSPRLCYMDLQISTPVSEVEAELTDMLSKLTNLKTVVMPRFTITSSIMTTLSRLPALRTIQSRRFTDLGSEDPSIDVQPFSPALSEGAFPSLKSLACDSPLCNITSFFVTKFAPGNLTSLHVQTPSFDTRRFFFVCLTALSHTCKQLTNLGLHLTVAGRWPSLDEKFESISLEDVYPVLNFPYLVSFKLSHYRPLDVSDNDIDRLAKNWPTLESLDLNCEPVLVTQPNITFASFASLARHCPNLAHLALYLDPFPDILPPPLVPFKVLASLDFGRSPIKSADHAMLYLSDIFPPSCKIRYGAACNGVVKHTIVNNAYSAREVRRRQEGWMEVRDILPLLTRLRCEQRERPMTLEKKIEDLMRRIRALGAAQARRVISELYSQSLER